MRTLPIDDVLEKVKTALQAQPCLVLVAPPGAGKTTRVPFALLAESWLRGQRIIMLEPRRLAARRTANYMASILNEAVGDIVGYRVKFDTKVGPFTRIEVITEGVFLRMIQQDPALTGVGLVIFDEFHERSLDADIALALCYEAQSILRDDLHMLVMSATLAAQPVADLLGYAPVIVSEGQLFPVETRYLERRASERLEDLVTLAVKKTLQQDKGDVLVFLPGAGEIHRVKRALEAFERDDSLHVMPLYGNLPQKEQDRALAPSKQGERKVILATSIAETSLTVEGVHIVIDCGFMRQPRFSPRTGMSHLDTFRVSLASADQRRGRAGRLGPGICYRLWTKQEERYLLRETVPEILAADLTGLVLELALWGVKDPAELAWLNPPPAAAIQQARQLLTELGALDASNGITQHGKRMAAAGIHPRLAHMIVKATELGWGSLACKLAAVLTGRELSTVNGFGSDADLRRRIDVLQGRNSQGVDPVIYQQVKREAAYLGQRFGLAKDEQSDSSVCGLLLAFAYPDRIAKRRSDGRYLLKNGRGARLRKDQLLGREPYIVAAELADAGIDSLIYLAAPVAERELLQYFSDQMIKEELVEWDEVTQSVQARTLKWLGALLMKERVLLHPSAECVLKALLQGIRQSGLTILPWSKGAQQLRLRLAFMHAYVPEDWPDMSDETLLVSFEEWLAPYLMDLSRCSDLQRLNLLDILTARLTWQQQQELNVCAPTHMLVPSGQKIPIDYSNPLAPSLSVRLQQLFGQLETPKIMRGKVALTIELLSPAGRPVQITQDLSNFWQTTYFAVKKDLMARYPKHYWPEDPLTALPTHRVRPKT
jgi:ATP-dependent helicase HrpB